ncbi:MAG: TIGR00725 family protein [Candidatus Aminicenantes bacterium]|nr:TIGR00725 family protein [Candidatus Aminicenantes bacterium]
MNEVRERKRVGIIGGSQPKPYQLDLAYQVGQLIAKKGGLLVCGGLGGVMEAAARGAKEAGGLTIGVLPGINYQEANPYIDFPLATGLGHARNVLVVLNSDVLIAIGGEYGTLSEIAFGRIYGRKIISLDSWDIPGVIKARTPEEACELAWL